MAAILEWATQLKNIYGPEWLAANLNGQEFALRTGTGRGIPDVEGLLKSEAQKAQESQQAMGAQAALSATPNLVKGAVDLAKENPEAVMEAINGSE